jgi:rRNA maturation endonuclease Nob1
MKRNALRTYSRDCRRCNKTFRTSGKFCKICSECRLPVGSRGVREHTDEINTMMILQGRPVWIREAKA